MGFKMASNLMSHNLPIRPRPSQRTGATENDAQDDLALLRRPLNEWSSEQKTALCLLVRMHGDNNWALIRDIFQRAFHLDLLKRGFFQPGLGSTGLTSQAARTQYDTLIRKNSPEYVNVCISTNLEDLKWKFATTYFRLVNARIEEFSKTPLPEFEAAVAEGQYQAAHKHQVRSIISSECSTDQDHIVCEAQGAPQYYPEAPTKDWSDSRAVIPKHDGLPFIGFRVYSDFSAGRNSREYGFTAEAFCGNDADAYEPPPRPHDARLIAFATDHLNHELIPSPLISMSDSFIWSLARCATEARKGIKTRIAVINTFAIDVPVYPTAPLCNAVVAAGKNKGWSYGGTCEYFVWRRIAPGPAILADVAFSDICNLCESVPDVAKILQLEKIKRNCWSVWWIRKRLNKPITEDERMATTLGRLIRWFKPDVYVNDPFVKNFMRVLMQNFKFGSEDLQQNRKFLTTLETNICDSTTSVGECREESAAADEVRTLKGVFVTPKSGGLLQPSSLSGLLTPPNSGRRMPVDRAESRFHSASETETETETEPEPDCSSPCVQRGKKRRLHEAC